MSRPPPLGNGQVSVVLASHNAKVSGGGAHLVSTTAGPTRNCESTGCPFWRDGCYARPSSGGKEGLHDARRSEASAKAASTPEQDARAEAEGLERLPPAGQPLRLHTAGDCATPEAARTVAEAVRRWRARGGGPAWGYTHAWDAREARTPVSRTDWAGVSMLASVESIEGAARARAEGWVPAIVLPLAAFPARTWRDALGQRWLACPAQTVGASCATCRACFDDERLRRTGYGIAFLPHGKQARRIRAIVARIQRSHGVRPEAAHAVRKD